MVYITGVHLDGGGQHEHIARVRWLDCNNGASNNMTTEEAINYLDKHNNLRVGGLDGPVAVAVVRPEGRKPYLRTVADNQWTDNLLSLPRF